MSEKVNQFLDSVCAYIKYKPIHQDIRDELTVHINELKEKYIEESQDEEIALDMAISAMGDCAKIGKHLDKQHRPKTEWSLVGLTAVIAIVGGIVMYTSSFFQSYNAVNFEKYLLSATLGIAILVCIYFFDYTKLKKLALALYIFTFALLIVVHLSGQSYNGMRRWLVLGDVSISTEFVTLLFLVSFSGFIEKYRNEGSLALIKLIALAIISLIPIMMEPNIKQALILLFVYLVMIFSAVIRNHFSGSRKRKLIFLGALFGIFNIMFINYLFQAPYRVARFSNFLTKGTSDPNGSGYQQAMADKWLKASNLFGTTNVKINGHNFGSIMPNITTDFAIINIFATLGLIIGTLLILIIAVYIFRIFVTTKKIKDGYGFYLSLASCSVLALQFILGILINFNLFPIVSVYIPFISYGGTGYIVSMSFLGLILSVWRRNNLIPTMPKKNNNNRDFIQFNDRKIIINLKQE